MSVTAAISEPAFTGHMSREGETEREREKEREFRDTPAKLANSANRK